ncbi:flagellar hook assembly protein FlgD [Caloramator sp. ALD01]|uniref:Flagellar basal-body rod modification protein FlgD n=1 Tax=Caloramator proteoclasticus DSM 10124 TaxID=1121262 RepID=A0A1M4STP6_9CLOT|nr:flagellar basal-body rod modification protein FlgD [Caloramator proteoclasticus DSM 10124]
MEINKILNDSNLNIRNKNSILDKNAFLKILTVQLSNQDPLNAKDNTEYVAQMAQFSALEQMQNLNSTMEKLYASQRFSQAINMIGKEVEVIENNIIKKVFIESTKVIGNNVYLISDGYQYNLDDVISINSFLKEDSTKDENLNK